MESKINFIRHIRLWGIILLVALAGIILTVNIISSYCDFNNCSKKMRTAYVARQKHKIKQEVLRVVDMINYRRSLSEKRTKELIKKRVYEAHTVAQHIYEKNKNKKSAAEIEQLIIDALSPVRFENGKGYLFICRLDGTTVLFPSDPRLVGENLLNSSDTNAQNITKELFKIVNQSGEGFYKYQWIKPGMISNNYKKIAFVKRFEPRDWIIGAGLYVEDVEKKTKKELLSNISRIRFGKEGYIFVNRLNGDSLVTSGELIGGEKKLWEVFNKDPEKTKELFKKELKAAQNPEGDFIYYSLIKLTNQDKESPKTSFIFGIPEWKWIIGAGVYLDDVEREIALIKAKMDSQIKRNLFYFGISTLSVVFLYLLFFNKLTRKLKNDLELFSSFFNRTVFSNEPIDIEKIKFSEFAQMAEDANKMLQDKIKAQQDLLDEKEQLFVTIRSIGDGIITTDELGNVELMNPIAEKLTGWSLEKAKGKKLSEIFHIIDEATRKTIANPVNEALKKGCIVGLANHTILISKDGYEYNIADSAAPIRDASSRIRGVVLVFRDVTEKRKTEKELLKTKKLESIGILAGGIAHDFNNILTGVFGNIELAKSQLSPEHPAYKLLGSADYALDKVTHLTKQLLTFAKGGDPILEAVDLKSVVQSTVSFNLSGSNVKAEFNLPDDLWQVKADKGQLSQVIANLIINAKEAMPEGGSLYIEAVNTENPLSILTGAFVKLTLRDKGIGIPKEYLEKVFDPYFSTKQTGSGLGLSTVHSIIAKHNGYISVDSTSGKGTTFTIYIPTEKVSNKCLSKVSKTSSVKSKKLSGRVLMMDDEMIIRDVAEAMLELCGYKADFAIDGKETIRKYIDAQEKGKPYDIIIMDLTVPGGMGGKETIKKILEINPKAKVIVSSGYSTDSIMANYSEYGFKGRIIKPFQLKDLEKELSRIMEM